MNNASKPPEETPTPSTDSLPSFTEWCSFFESKRHLLDGGTWGPEVMAELTQAFLAQRGSRPS